MSIMKQPQGPGGRKTCQLPGCHGRISVAAIDYAYGLNPKEVILLGSSYSASLVLLEGLNHPNVNAIIAFSPGEYFGNDLRMEDSLKTCSKPLFVAVTEREQPYVKQMLAAISRR